MEPHDLRSASIESIFLAAGALRDGHFLLKSGRHSGRYLEKFAVLQYPTFAVEIGRRLARALAAENPTLVVGPTTFQPFIRIGNLFDEQYSGSVIINAFGGRYYEPAPGRTLQIGLNLVL